MTAPRWEVFRGRRGERVRQHSPDPTVRLARWGVITFNPAATALFDGADAILLLMAPDAIGFRPSSHEDRNSYRLWANGNQANVTAIAFSREVGHDPRTSTLHPARWDPDSFTLVVDWAR